MRFASSVCKNWEDISNTARQHQRMANAVVPMAEGLRVNKTGSSGTRADQRTASRNVGFKSPSAQVSLRYSKFSLSSVRSSNAQRCAVNNPRRGISKCQGSDKTRIARDRAALQAAAAPLLHELSHFYVVPLFFSRYFHIFEPEWLPRFRGTSGSSRSWRRVKRDWAQVRFELS